jgi:hypothetical protein
VPSTLAKHRPKGGYFLRTFQKGYFLRFDPKGYFLRVLFENFCTIAIADTPLTSMALFDTSRLVRAPAARGAHSASASAVAPPAWRPFEWRTRV